MGLTDELKRAKKASYVLASLSSAQKSQALEVFAVELKNASDAVLAANKKDLKENENKISSSLFQRLKITTEKIETLRNGIVDLAQKEDPCGKVSLRRHLDDGLVLERVSVPLGVLGIIFESRPDAVPQILSLALKSGNGAVLKGGKEAKNSIRAIMDVVEKCRVKCPFLPEGWAVMLETREDVDIMLSENEYIDLVIPRGSNELVEKVMASTKIPVLGHADGICHIYVESSANIEMALRVIVDSKIQYPSACNAVETVLVDQSLAEEFLPDFFQQMKLSKIEIFGGDRVRKVNPSLSSVENWSHEYGEPQLSLEIVDGFDEAVSHIQRYGSSHTDAIITEDSALAEKFLKSLDSANVFHNASTRFADGYRYGFGAEVGISTAKTHARGPVGIEGLVIYKYLVRGSGQIVDEYSGADGKTFLHRDESVDD